VSFVRGAGNSARVVNYQVTDAKVFNKMNSQIAYYRIKQVDMDGQFSYSNIVRVNKNSNQIHSVSVYPNPFVNTTAVSLNTNSSGTAQVEITDIQGRLIGGESVSVQTGLNMIPVTTLSDARTGIYFVKITIDGESQVLKVVKQ
jgi:hypothetical protein